MTCEPLVGWRRWPQPHRGGNDWALFIRELLDGRYRDIERVVLVIDQLNTHFPALFYQAFPPAEAKRLAERLEVHDTPKHGSWLNVTKIELGTLACQCLARRIAQHDTRCCHVAAWKEQPTAAKAKVTWQFTTRQARIKLKSLYPSIQG